MVIHQVSALAMVSALALAQVLEPELVSASALASDHVVVSVLDSASALVTHCPVL